MKLNLQAQLDVVQIVDRDAVFENADRLMELMVDGGFDSPTVGVTATGDTALVEVEFRCAGRSAAAAVAKGTRELKAALLAVGWAPPPNEIEAESSTVGRAREPVVAAA